MAQHPFEIIELIKTEKYKKPREIQEDEYIYKKPINPYTQEINNLNQDIKKILNDLEPLQKEYNREMEYRKDLHNTFNNINDNQKKHLFKKK